MQATVEKARELAGRVADLMKLSDMERKAVVFHAIRTPQRACTCYAAILRTYAGGKP